MSHRRDSHESGWTVRKVKDADEQDERTYRYWQGRPLGERIVATWELSEAAHSIKKKERGLKLPSVQSND